MGIQPMLVLHSIHLYLTLSTCKINLNTSSYVTWFTAGDAICIAHYDVIDDVITQKL